MKTLIATFLLLSFTLAIAEPPPPPPAKKVSNSKKIYDALDVVVESYNREDGTEINAKEVGCFSCEKETVLGRTPTYACGVRMEMQCEAEALYKAIKGKESEVKKVGGLVCSKIKNLYNCSFYSQEE